MITNAPQVEEYAEKASSVILRKNMNSAGIETPEFRNAAHHPGLHTDLYYRTVNSFLSGCTSQEEVYEVLRYIAEELLGGNFPH